MTEFMRFIAIGGMNTGVDFIILNTLIAVFGLGNDPIYFALFKIVSFSVAVINSFFWNKKWVFKHSTETGKNTVSEISPFLSVSLLSLLFNLGIATAVYNAGLTLFPDLSVVILANLGAAAGTGLSFIFNFIGYKFFVFKKSEVTLPS